MATYFDSDMESRVCELEESNTALRGALIFAGRRINQLHRNDKSLAILRDALKQMRSVAKATNKLARLRLELPRSEQQQLDVF